MTSALAGASMTAWNISLAYRLSPLVASTHCALGGQALMASSVRLYKSPAHAAHRWASCDCLEDTNMAGSGLGLVVVDSIEDM